MGKSTIGSLLVPSLFLAQSISAKRSSQQKFRE
jgi:hypothetical protein